MVLPVLELRHEFSLISSHMLAPFYPDGMGNCGHSPPRFWLYKKEGPLGGICSIRSALWRDSLFYKAPGETNNEQLIH